MLAASWFGASGSNGFIRILSLPRENAVASVEGSVDARPYYAYTPAGSPVGGLRDLAVRRQAEGDPIAVGPRHRGA